MRCDFCHYCLKGDRLVSLLHVIRGGHKMFGTPESRIRIEYITHVGGAGEKRELRVLGVLEQKTTIRGRLRK